MGDPSARAALLLAFLVCCTTTSYAQDTVFDYDTDSSGYWHEGSNWDQGTGPDGANHVVVIDRPSASPTITFNSTSGTRLVKSLTSEESIILSGGTLEVLTNAQLNGSFMLSGGTLKGGAVHSISGIDVTSSANNSIDGIALTGDLQLTSSGDYVKVLNGLTLNGTANLSGSSATLDFAGTQTLGASSGQTATVDMLSLIHI